MARYVNSLQFAKSPEELFDFMADFSNAPEWDPATSVGEKLTPGPVDLGSKTRIVTRFAGRDVDLTYEVVEYDRPRKVVVRAEKNGTVAEDTLSVAPVEGGSELTYDAEVQLRGLAKLADPLINLQFQKIGGEASEGLRKTLGPPPEKPAT